LAAQVENGSSPKFTGQNVTLRHTRGKAVVLRVSSNTVNPSGLRNFFVFVGKSAEKTVVSWKQVKVSRGNVGGNKPKMTKRKGGSKAAWELKGEGGHWFATQRGNGSKQSREVVCE